MFLVPRPASVDLLVRAAQDRRVADEEQRPLRATLAACPVATTVVVDVPRQGARRARQATLAVRWHQVVRRPPPARTSDGLPDGAVWAVGATETSPPAGVAPLDWLLLTTGAVHTTADAAARRAWSACRWGSEVFHQVRTAGCASARRRLATLDHRRRC